MDKSDLVNLLVENGFMKETRGDYESAEGGLPDWKRMAKNKDGVLISEFLIEQGFAAKEIQDKKGRTWVEFHIGEAIVVHRKWSELKEEPFTFVLK